MPTSARAQLTAALLGLIVGVGTLVGQGHLDHTANALVNSVSAWLIAPFVAGAVARHPLDGILAGLTAALAEVIGYYAYADLRGIPESSLAIAFWIMCALVSGPLFGAAGRVWRAGDRRGRGLGGALIPAAFIAEGLWLYLHELHDLSRATLWLALAAASGAVLLRRPAERRWLVPATAAALVGEAGLTVVTAAHAWI
jgi:hypothetical protein